MKLLRFTAIILTIKGSSAFTNPLFRVFKKNVVKFTKTSIFVSGLNNMINFSNDMDIIDHKVRGSLKNADDITLPTNIVVNNHNCGNEWAYSQLIHYIETNYVKSISIDPSGKFLIAMDNLNKFPRSLDLHYVHIIPIHMSDLINMLVQHNIDFNVMSINN
mgnify:CR=1 FL=1